ncbi:uncharacterized protein SPAPADRAFT_134999 [Spathaspora passalidarum NRRL Y-27907]|uniref:Nitrogen permease regulator 3 n=1 Tax=Spathaspora passalidarum (strain NRRL Y-27907 / 11-Y1) TaxID=619300 RepID=G3AJM5_SPAPN|nr:uncharacterized protein SPAPADRAFT_134999 [Spathaspora passalidarum NRRL Y-27907]EGW33926.1 hypothetical protein SPAPADRAFT_134999 [Spathaspora passalidarum NRRL Y-27907]
MSFNLPNPSLLGVLLVISTHSGPQLAYKYPPSLNESSNIPKFKDVNNWHYSSEEEDDDDDELYGQQSSSDDSDQEFTKRDLYEYSSGTNSAWDTHHIDYYLGTKLDLLSFLDEQNQRRSYLNKVKRAATANKSSTKKTTAKTEVSNTDNTIYGIDPAYLCEMLAPPKKMCNTRFELTIENKVFLGLPIHKYDDGHWRKPSEKNKSYHDHDGDIDNELAEDPKPDDSPSKPRLSLNMFHLVFIMNPPMIESNYRIDEMFHYVISRLSLVLRYEQSKHDYICDQVKSILTIKDQYTDEEELQTKLLEKSSLCKLIHDCYNSITTSKIANLLINGKLRSFQIPIKTEFHSLPDSTVPYIPGSYLSSTTNLLNNTGLINIGETSRYGHTFNAFREDDEEEDVIMYFALLLLDEPESMIRDIKTDKQSNMANFIRMVDSRQSLFKLSARLKLDIMQIKSFAYHLIYWRRARIIQPLSTRSVFIVSPMAPISLKLIDDIVLFKEKFPTLPSLPHFLKLLSPQSRKPQQFASIIPSKDHRESYLQALAWLIRFGYVTQLQTFIWLKISRNIKIKVEEDLENENLNKKKKKSLTTSTDNTFKPTDNTSKRDQGKHSLVTSPPEQPLKTTLPTVTLTEEDDTIILDPGRASNLERKWINKIIFEECKLSSELTTVFYKLLKYMNGKSSLELLLLKENISILELRKLLFEIEDYIISVRHW